MSYTADEQLELIASGQADWDTSINANFNILERGKHLRAIAGSAISSGQVCSVTGSGTVIPTDVLSKDFRPHVMSYRDVGSGSTAQFILDGTVRSMTVWSAHITPGQPVFIAANSPGFVVRSYAGHREPIGLAILPNAVRFFPGYPRIFPDYVSVVTTFGQVTVGGSGTFALLVGNRGIVRDVVLVSSHDRTKLKFWSGSSRVASELLYETLTRSYSPGSADIASTYFRDAAMFPYRNTDASTFNYIYGAVDVQSGTGVSSAYVSVAVIVERFS